MRRAFLVLVVAIVLGVALLPAAHAAADTLLLMPELFPNAPARPLDWVTPPPRRTTVTIRNGDRASVASLYDPGTPGRHGAVVIFLGVAPAGLDDPRVVRLGEGLARIGIVTLIPQSQDLVNSKVDPGEIDTLIASFDYLAGRPDVDPGRVGLGGFCIGAGLSLDAAEDPRINQRVALVNSFTGYYDLSSYAVSIITHTIEPFPPEPGVAHAPWDPAANATQVLDDHLISLDPSVSEENLLRTAAHDPQAARPDPARLSPIGREILTVLTTRDPATVQRLLGDLPPADQEILRRLSPSTHLADLHAKVFIMHDHDDSTVPYVQSRLLLAHLKPGQGEYDEFSFFQHVDPTATVSPVVFARDASRLAWHMFQIVEILQGAVPVQHF
ncbi:MAG: dienelactone hydrolase family protein [Chloroflexota bacterium]